MATIAVSLEPQPRSVQSASPRFLDGWLFSTSFTAALTLLAVAIGGYHPFAEDGGLYAAGVERLLDPTLFPHWTNFVVAPTRVSAFAPAVAALVRISHLSLPAVLLLVHFGTVWATLCAAYGIAECCWESLRARFGAVVLLGCWLGLPVAGTSLLVMDPYVTARSFSTPCTLFALFCVLRATSSSTRTKGRSVLLAGLSLAVAFAMHPLMASYGIGATCLLICLRSERKEIRRSGAICCCAFSIIAAALLNHWATPESESYVRAALTRSYWFPTEWAWYELTGLIAPLAILARYLIVVRARYGGDHRHGWDSSLAAIVEMAIVLGVTAILVALLFAWPGSHAHLVARLQPLRAFQIVYLVMMLSLGALLGEHLLGRRIGRWVAAVLVLAAPLYLADRSIYGHSSHIQISVASDGNQWIQSFAWIRTHTPKDALFALDPDYIHATGEDGHCFRAIAQRSVLPDYSKDGGEASVAPQLAESWQFGLDAQRSLSSRHLDRNSAEVSELQAMGVSWVILRANKSTNLKCPYSNSAAKVCTIKMTAPK